MTCPDCDGRGVRFGAQSTAVDCALCRGTGEVLREPYTEALRILPGHVDVAVTVSAAADVLAVQAPAVPADEVRVLGRALPPGHVGIVDPPPVPLHGPTTCTDHGPTATMAWTSGDGCPLCEAYADVRRLREALAELAELLGRNGIGAGDSPAVERAEALLAQADRP